MQAYYSRAQQSMCLNSDIWDTSWLTTTSLLCVFGQIIEPLKESDFDSVTELYCHPEKNAQFPGGAVQSKPLGGRSARLTMAALLYADSGSHASFPNQEAPASGFWENECLEVCLIRAEVHRVSALSSARFFS